jgi:hypothetical protein
MVPQPQVRHAHARVHVREGRKLMVRLVPMFVGLVSEDIATNQSDQTALVPVRMLVRVRMGLGFVFGGGLRERLGGMWMCRGMLVVGLLLPLPPPPPPLLLLPRLEVLLERIHRRPAYWKEAHMQHHHHTHQHQHQHHTHQHPHQH